MPNALPTTTDPITEKNPTHNEIRAPWIIRENISLPKSSVPNQYSLKEVEADPLIFVH